MMAAVARVAMTVNESLSGKRVEFIVVISSINPSLVGVEGRVQSGKRGLQLKDCVQISKDKLLK